MSTETVRKTLSYKRAHFTGVGNSAGLRLSQLVASALSALPTVGQRRQPLGPADERPIWRLVGQFSQETEFVFGVLVQYAPGTNAVLVVDDADAGALTMEQMVAPLTDDGKRRELPEGMLFFAVLDNHVAIMQSTAMRSDHLEKHLQWLLHQSSAMQGTTTVQLTDQPPRQTIEMVRTNPVKSVSIGGGFAPLSALQPPAGNAASTAVGSATPVTTTSSVTAVASHGEARPNAENPVWSALKSLIGPSAASRLNLDELNESNIEYSLRITYKRSTTEEGERALETIGMALRNTEEVDCTVKLKDGSTIRGADLKLAGSIKVTLYDGSPTPTDVYEAMRSWLLQKIETGEVSA